MAYKIESPNAGDTWDGCAVVIQLDKKDNVPQSIALLIEQPGWIWTASAQRNISTDDWVNAGNTLTCYADVRKRDRFANGYTTNIKLLINGDQVVSQTVVYNNAKSDEVLDNERAARVTQAKVVAEPIFAKQQVAPRSPKKSRASAPASPAAVATGDDTNQLRQELQKTQATVQQKEREIAQLKDQQNRTSQRVSQLQDSLKQKETEIVQLKSQQQSDSGAASKQRQQTGEADALRARAASLQTSVQQKEAEVAQLKAALTKQTGEREAAQQALERKAAEVAALEQQVQAAKTQLTSALAEKDRQIELLQQRIALLEQRGAATAAPVAQPDIADLLALPAAVPLDNAAMKNRPSRRKASRNTIIDSPPKQEEEAAAAATTEAVVAEPIPQVSPSRPKGPIPGGVGFGDIFKGAGGFDAVRGNLKRTNSNAAASLPKK